MAKEADPAPFKAARTNTRSKDFNKLYDKLSDSAKRLVDGALALYLENPAHPGLRAHKLKDSKKGRHPGPAAHSAMDKQDGGELRQGALFAMTFSVRFCSGTDGELSHGGPM